MVRRSGICAAAIAGIVALATGVRAEEPPNVAAQQVAGLFMQSCIQFAGDSGGLRGWARKTGLNVLPAAVQQRFLYGLPGVVFDASSKGGKFVLVSEDGGSCSTLAEMASGPVVISTLERNLSDARISFKVTGEKADSEERVLQHREYHISQGSRELLLLISTVKDPVGGQAMLTANRN